MTNNSKFLQVFLTTLLLLLFSPDNILRWVEIKSSLVYQIKTGSFQCLQNKDFSMRSSFRELKEAAHKCRGIMSMEPTFLGAFLELDQKIFYDIWEIPPFGEFGDSTYYGLRPDRIDCLFVSHNLETDEGGATNSGVRYRNYIKPYIERLKILGASTYELPKYGKLYILGN